MIIKTQQRERKVLLNLRLLVDSLLWVSARSGTGIEGFRLLFRKDSVIILGRLRKSYYIHDYEQLSKKWKTHFNFFILQDILLGNPPWYSHATRQKENSFHIQLEFKKKPWYIEYNISKKLKRIEDIQIHYTDKKKLLIKYQDFHSVGKSVLAHSLQIDLTYQQKEIQKVHHYLSSIYYLKVDISEKKPIKLTFKIPSRYKKMILE